jgi:hypothetical protein
MQETRTRLVWTGRQASGTVVLCVLVGGGMERRRDTATAGVWTAELATTATQIQEANPETLQGERELTAALVRPTAARVTGNRGMRELMRVLQVLFQRQAMDVASRLTVDGEVPDMTGWVAVTAGAAKPLLLRLTQHGIVETRLRLAAKLGKRPQSADDDMRRYVLPAGEVFGKAARAGHVVTKAADVRVDFDLFNPRVLDAVDAAAFRFCRETMETATAELGTALTDLRHLLKRGLGRGEALRLLAKRVHEIFADPTRAYRIAVTESSRAQHAGQLMAAKDSGVVKKKAWLASSDACDLCLELEERGPIGLDEPFYVDMRGGPYATVLAPPAHPYCYCVLTDEIE